MRRPVKPEWDDLAPKWDDFRTAPPADSSSEGRGPLWELLDWVEQVLLRMIIGVFRFIFRKLPRFIYDVIKYWVPIFAKFLKVTFIAAFLGVVVVGPSVIAMKQMEQNRNNVDMLTLVMFGWTALSVVGMIWGLFWIRHRKRGLFSAVKQAFVEKGDEC
jgi:hypothetical protein